MPILVNSYQLKKSFGAKTLFNGLTFSVESGERIGLIGPNGAGKSTLLKIIASEESPDGGTLSFQKGLRVGYLKQNPVLKGTVFSAVLDAVQTSQTFEYPWEAAEQVEASLARLELLGPNALDKTTSVDSLSGGWRKKVALACELAKNPDLLLLDEPTNHLDVESILWLEELLKNSQQFATLTITHDRAFLQNISNRIIELDRRNPEGLLSVKGSYADYVETKSLLLEQQKSRELSLRNTLRRETEWLRRGAKARTTKQQARIHRAEDLKDEVSRLQARNMDRSVRLEFQNTERAPKKLLEARKISKAYSDKRLFEDFSLTLTHQSRIGILGKNGSGKSTLIRVLLGDESPDSGEVIRSDLLKVAYFEQDREVLEPDQTLIRTLCPSGDHVIFQGKSIHIRSYLDRFLFDQTQMNMPVGKLSGGEQSRVLIARLMLREANLLVLDEPTNDLDLPTLNVLEECLEEFPGAIILVTHDRYFLDNISDQILAFDSQNIISYADLAQWESQIGKATKKKDVPAKASREEVPAKKKKLTFKEQKELESMEEKILQAEQEVSQLTDQTTNPEIAANPKRLQEVAQSLAQAHQRVEELYRRWAELSEQA